MRRAQLAIFCLLILWCASAAAANPPAVVPDSTVVIGVGSPGPYWVSGYFILLESEEIARGGHALVRGADYTIEYNRGRVMFADTLCANDTLLVRFSRLGFALASQWAQPEPSQPEASESSAPMRSVRAIETVPLTIASNRSSSTSSPPARLRWSGYKSFSFSADEARDAEWSQGLELAAEGELFEGLNLSAAVSDRTMGVGGSSNDGTALSDLDRLFIEARSARFHGRWGELQRQPGDGRRAFASGLQAEWNGSQHGFSGYLMHPHGEWRRVRIALSANDAGPYALSGSSGATAVVAGSASVWLDGGRLVEGIDADFTIDASRGALTLSPRVRADQQSVLIVEYQQALDDYQRTLAGSSWSWRRADSALGNALSVSWEGDDPSRPLFGVLTDEQRRLLAQASDGRAVLGAYEHSSDNDGDYRLDLRDGDTVFVYVGPGNGSWRVRFEWSGEGKGSYRHLVDDAYEFVGNGGGSYSATITLDAPRSRLVAEESFQLRSRQLGALQLDWQGIGNDPNRLAPGNASLLSNHRLCWQRNWHDSLASASLIWHRQGVDDNVVSTEAKSYADLSRFAQAWQMRSSFFDSKHDEVGATLAAPLSSWFAFGADAGRWDAGNLAARRGGIRFALAPHELLALNAAARRRWIDGADLGDADSRSYETTAKLGTLRRAVEAGWREENVVDSARLLESVNQYGGTRWLGLHGLGLDLRQEWRTYREFNLGAIERTREFSVTAPASVLHAQGGSGLTLVRGERRLGGADFTPYYGGRLNSQWRPNSQMQLSAQIQLTQLHAGAQREVYLPTRTGQGDYRYERGEYIPDPQGDYRRVLVEDEDATASVYEGTRQLALNWRPELGGWRWTFDLSRRLDARYALSAFSPSQWLLPWTSERDAVAPGARLSTHDDHRVSVQPRQKTRLSLTLAVDRQLIPKAAANARDLDELSRKIESEWREDLTRVVYMIWGGQFQTQRRNGSTAVAVDADARALRVSMGVAPQPGLGFALESRRRIDRDFTQSGKIDLWGLRPSARLHRGALSVTLNGDFTWVDASRELIVSPLLAEGRPKGSSVTESAEVNVQLPARLSVQMRLSGDHRHKEADRWRMYVETVARF